jgi:hypothetical protein
MGKKKFKELNNDYRAQVLLIIGNPLCDPSLKKLRIEQLTDMFISSLKDNINTVGVV